MPVTKKSAKSTKSWRRAMIQKPDRKELRARRHMRIRRRLTGTQERPRLCVYRSNKHIYAQIVDDASQKTLVSASTLDPEMKGKKSWDTESARTVGKLVADKAKAKGAWNFALN